MYFPPRLFASFGALLLALATALAAWHAHGLVETLDEHAYAAFGRALQHQFLSGIGLVALAAWLQLRGRDKLLELAAALLLVGILLFAGDVYLGSLGGSALGVAPFGGSLLIGAWLLAAVGFLRSKK